MKNSYHTHLLVTLISLLCVYPCNLNADFSKRSSSDAKEQIVQANTNATKAYVNNNPKLFEEVLDEDFIIIDPIGEVIPKDKFISCIANKHLHFNSLENTSLLNVTGEKNKEQFSRSVLFTRTFEKQPDGR